MPSRRWLVLLAFLFVAGCQSHEDTPSLAQPHYHSIKGTEANDWTIKERRMMPPCDKPAPCTHDLKGTDGPDRLYQNKGWDWLNSKGGDDLLRGGDGMDQLYAGDGKDKVFGNFGHDHLWGGDGDDYIDASDGLDEKNHVEEVHGNQQKKNESGTDTCIIDADKEGAIVSDCHKLVVKPIDSYSGPTTLYKTKQDKDAGESYREAEPGTYFEDER